MPHTSCAKCSRAMIAGFVPDLSYASVFTGTWYEGAPEKNFLGNVKIKGEPYPITTYRCSACGFLESYAQPKAT